MIAASAKQIEGGESLAKEFNPELKQNWIAMHESRKQRQLQDVHTRPETTNQSTSVGRAAAFWLSGAAMPQLLTHY